MRARRRIAPSGRRFCAGLVKRGLRGVRLVISDAHEGLKRAVATVLSGTTWQRCRVHFMRNLLATIPRSAREPVAAIVRTIFAQPDRATAQAQLRKVVDGLRGAVCAGRRAARARRRGRARVPALPGRAPAAAALAPIRSSGSTRRSSAARPSSASSRTATPCSAWWARFWPSRTTSGRWLTAGTSARNRCSSSRSRWCRRRRRSYWLRSHRPRQRGGCAYAFSTT